MTEVAKTYKEDLTKLSLQNASVAHLPAKRQKKKGVSKPAAVKIVVNSSDNDKRQVLSKHARPSQFSQGSSSYSKNKSN